MGAYDEVLSEPFEGTEAGIAEENIQARIRGNLLMALSNKFGWLVLTTGNKSEYSVGYTTLYGDMAGGFGVLKDVPKTLVYRLAHYRNGLGGAPVDPGRDHRARAVGGAARPTSATRTACPPYDLLDAILEAYVEEDQGRDQLIRRGMPGGRRGPCDPDGRRSRVQAPPGAARHQDHPEGVRPRPAPADHEPVSGRSPTRFGQAPALPLPTSTARTGHPTRAWETRPGPHGDRRAHERAQAPVVVGDLDLPDPGGAAAPPRAWRARSRGRSLIGRMRLALIS